MPNVDAHAANTFCYAELATTDAGAAKAFYTELFGWSYAESPLPGGGLYTMLSLRDRYAAALYGLGPQQRAQRVASHWMNYVSVSSAEQTVQNGRELGATIVAAPLDVMDLGRMAVLMDPSGAAFSIWQPKTAIGAQLINEPGAMCWNELATRDVEGSRRFYGDLFGWAGNTESYGSSSYTEFRIGERSVGGMVEMTEEFGNVPPHWLPYFCVANCDESAARATGLRGSLKVPPTDIPKVGRFSIIQDPTGAVLAIISFNSRMGLFS
jgi:predicted enzyme related to lactoylglutathione lyase